MDIAGEIAGLLKASGAGATVLALQGDLGAGKTTLTKALAQKLGVTETVVSPTFVIAKFYPATEQDFETVVHMDAYRIESLDELAPLGWKALLQRPNTLIVIEWPEKIARGLPAERLHFAISHEGNQRRITRVV